MVIFKYKQFYSYTNFKSTHSTFVHRAIFNLGGGYRYRRPGNLLLDNQNLCHRYVATSFADLAGEPSSWGEVCPGLGGLRICDISTRWLLEEACKGRPLVLTFKLCTALGGIDLYIHHSIHHLYVHTHRQIPTHSS